MTCWNMICRVCLESGEMVSLFDCDENNEVLSEKYTYCCGIEVEEEDTLPTLICLTCVDKLLAAHRFKKQSLESVSTLKECLDEFTSVTGNVPEKSATTTETITIKQENGVFLQYELPIETKESLTWVPNKKKKCGRPRKNPDASGNIETPSSKRRKKSEPEKPKKIKLEPLTDGENEDIELPEGDDIVDPDYMPDGQDQNDTENDEPLAPEGGGTAKKKKGKRSRKSEKIDMDDNGEDILLREALLAGSEPVVLKSREKKRKESKRPYNRKQRADHKSYTCEQCGAAFNSNATLQGHIRRHLGIKPYSCSICEYKCVMKTELKRHMYRHTGVKPYQCRVCNRGFSDFGSRQKHERLHVGEKPYVCSLCGKAFTYSYVLSNHMLTHTGIKKYSCEPCNKKFTKAHHLKYHNKVHHKDLYIKLEFESQARKFRQQLKISDPEALQFLAGPENMQLLQQVAAANQEQNFTIVGESTDGMNQSADEDTPNDDVVSMLSSDLSLQRVTDEHGETRLIYQLPTGVLRHSPETIVPDEEDDD